MNSRMDGLKIGKRLSDLRRERGETTAEVAMAIGSSQSAVSMYESGARIPRDNLKIELSRHFGVPVQQIFFAD